MFRAKLGFKKLLILLQFIGRIHFVALMYYRYRILMSLRDSYHSKAQINDFSSVKSLLKSEFPDR